MYILREVLVIEQVNKRDSLSFGGVVLVMKPFYAIWLWECKVYFFYSDCSIFKIDGRHLNPKCQF